MIVRPLKLDGTYEIGLSARRDPRGHFGRLFDAEIWAAHGLPVSFEQENEAFTAAKGTVRGLHFQAPPHAETKIVRCVAGAVFDVFVDLRLGSPTYGQWDGHVLNGDAPRWLVIPKGFAHGYCTLTDDTLFAYKVDARYAPAAESGLAWDDPTLAIQWPVREPILSERDRALPKFAGFASPFVAGTDW
jgi:dTDP-4-dehydrorhamnose 3,5-epimerase